MEAKGEAAFYGPEIDVQVRDAHDREETLSTVQLDFNQPERFELKYTAEDGSKARPVMIHRGLLGSMECMTALDRNVRRADRWDVASARPAPTGIRISR
ncbi:hypothetical protein O4214_10330 [Rhodococcus erythropolis]|uniref:aminoacyl--tRNA ligase-related protein n=1 Tax=Rhodococcus erythropolis TaxID=1833 RepID=UPI001E4F4843|nr:MULTISPECIES: aminoacyl--tRNA ligase-related protein [Rhodococcus erythropolis group]MCZ4524376.1 hypothetical protein [Rhodococcus erythropolis]